MFFFNETDEFVSFDDIQKNSQMDVEMLKQNIHSLCCRKYKLLEKSTKGKKINTTDSFRFNKKFSSQKKVFKVLPPSLEQTFNKEKVIESRSYAVEACIVRIMKHRK